MNTVFYIMYSLSIIVLWYKLYIWKDQDVRLHSFILEDLWH